MSESKPHIERYEFQHDSMYSAADGDWVKWDEYASLVEQVQALETQLAGAEGGWQAADRLKEQLEAADSALREIAGLSAFNTPGESGSLITGPAIARRYLGPRKVPNARGVMGRGWSPSTGEKP